MKVKRMKCDVCGKGVEDDVTLYRDGNRGVNAPWFCSAHIPSDSKPSTGIQDTVDASSDS